MKKKANGRVPARHRSPSVVAVGRKMATTAFFYIFLCIFLLFGVHIIMMIVIMMFFFGHSIQFFIDANDPLNGSTKVSAFLYSSGGRGWAVGGGWWAWHCSGSMMR